MSIMKGTCSLPIEKSLADFTIFGKRRSRRRTSIVNRTKNVIFFIFKSIYYKASSLVLLNRRNQRLRCKEINEIIFT